MCILFYITQAAKHTQQMTAIGREGNYEKKRRVKMEVLSGRN
jgi:hypothetical protein